MCACVCVCLALDSLKRDTNRGKTQREGKRVKDTEGEREEDTERGIEGKGD